MDALNENPAKVSVTDPKTGETYQTLANGDLFVNTLFLALYDPSQLPIFPTIVYNTRAGDYDLLSRLLPLLIFQPTVSVGMYQTVVCAEETNFDPAKMPVEGVRPELATLMRDSNESLFKVCDLWQVPKLGPQANEPVVSNIPTLLLSGRFDPITPVAFAEEAAKTLSQSYAYTFPNTSHGAFLFNACASGIAQQFLENPVVAPNDNCIAAEPTTFDIPTPEKVVMTPAQPRARFAEWKKLEWVAGLTGQFGGFALGGRDLAAGLFYPQTARAAADKPAPAGFFLERPGSGCTDGEFESAVSDRSDCAAVFQRPVHTAGRYSQGRRAVVCGSAAAAAAGSRNRRDCRGAVDEGLLVGLAASLLYPVNGSGSGGGGSVNSVADDGGVSLRAGNVLRRINGTRNTHHVFQIKRLHRTYVQSAAISGMVRRAVTPRPGLLVRVTSPS
ncbi:MAG: hypothetical protein HC875_38155 [Anaerolineales bacterium]|nr:hypothetical protein [Anaerolineales bacterium]